MGSIEKMNFEKNKNLNWKYEAKKLGLKIEFRVENFKTKKSMKIKKKYKKKWIEN